MGERDSAFGLAQCAVNKAFRDLSGDGVRESIREGALAVQERISIRYHATPRMPDIEEFLFPSTFNLDVVPFFEARRYSPIITIDPRKVSEISTDEFQADFVRTISIAAQYPINGYQDRMRVVYSRALDQEAAWLEDNAVSKIKQSDPRFENRSHTLKTLLGTHRYQYDVGYKDWQNALFLISGVFVDPLQREMLRVLGSPQRFVAEREIQDGMHAVKLLANDDFGIRTNDGIAAYIATGMVETALAGWMTHARA